MKKAKWLLALLLVLVCTVAMAGACEQKPELIAPQATLSGNVLSWEAVQGAEKYIVIINGESAETTETSYTLELSEPGVYDIYVSAVSGEEKKTSTVVSYTVKGTLLAPTITLSGNSVSWSAVEHAVKYEVIINSVSVGFANGTTYSVEQTEVGSYKIKIKAIGDDVWQSSVASNEVIYVVEEPGPTTVDLTAPVITLNGTTISWTAVENATRYDVYVDEVKLASTQGLSYRLPETLDEGKHSITVKAVHPGSDIYLDSANSNEVILTIAPLDLTKPLFPLFSVNGEVFTVEIGADNIAELKNITEVQSYDKYMWYLEVDENDSSLYNIKLADGRYLIYNGTTNAKGSEGVATLKESASQSSLQWKVFKDTDGFRFYNVAHVDRWSSGEWSYYFGVKGAENNALKFGDDCHKIILVNKDIPFVPVVRLASPVISLKGEQVVWNAVEEATGYEVYIDGELITTTTETSYTLTVDKAVVKVCAVCDQATRTSFFSNEENYEDLLKTLFVEPLIASYRQNNGKVTLLDVNDDGIVVIGPEMSSVTDYSKYVMELEKVTVEGGEGWYLIKLGDKYMKYEQTNYSDGSSAHRANAIIAEKDEADDAFWWKFINRSDGTYRIITSQVNSTNYYGEFYGVYKFDGQCNGWSFSVVPERLATPQTTVDGKVVSWEAVEHAALYHVFVDGQFESATEGTSFTLNRNVGGDYVVSVKALPADSDTKYFTSEAAEVIITVEALKLNAVVITINQATVSWEAVEHCTGYDIFADQTKLGTTAETSFTLNLTTSGTYQITVVVKGDGVHYADSNASNAEQYVITIELVDAPVLVLSENVVTWEAVEHATSYEVTLNDQVVVASQTELIYTIESTEVGSYTITVKALTTELGYTTSVVSNAVTMQILPPALNAPTPTIDGNVVSWEAVENAIGYEVFINDVSVGTQTALTFELTSDGVVAVVAKAEENSIEHRDSAKSEAVSYTFSFAQPVLATYKENTGVVYVAVVGDDNVVRHVAISNVSDFTRSMFYFEDAGEEGWYNIKLYNGYYLTYGSGDGGYEGVATPNNNSASQMWKVLDDGRIQNKQHIASWGDYYYGVWYDCLKFGGCSAWTLVNKNVPYDSSNEAEDPTDANTIVAWMYYPKNDGSKVLPEINDDGILILGNTIDSVSNYSNYVWTFEKITEGAGEGYWMIKLADGRYLAYSDTELTVNGSDKAQAIATTKDATDSHQWWKLVADGDGKYKLENEFLSHYYSDVYLGEWWGVFKFSGGCNAWVFNPVE